MTFDLTITALQAWIFLPAALPICAWAVYTDVKEFKIKNMAVLALLIAFVILGPFALEFSDYLWRYAHFAVVLGITFGLYALTGLGAGDAKMMAAFAPFVALPDVLTVIMIWWVCAIAMAIGLSRRAVQVAQADGFKAARKMKVPFGIALAPTLVIYLVLGIIQGAA